jgi:hypothetical protein
VSHHNLKDLYLTKLQIQEEREKASVDFGKLDSQREKTGQDEKEQINV